LLFFQRARRPLAPHSFPTRRSSDLAGPTMRHDQRQRVLLGGADVDEVDIDAVYLGDELRQGIQPCLDPPPIVVGAPVTHERLKLDRKSTRLNSSHDQISYAVFCLKK